MAEKFIPAITETDPDLLRMMRGIAVGSGQNLNSILALNCRSEILPPDYSDKSKYDSKRANRENIAAGFENWIKDDFSIPEDGECTSLVCSPEASAEGNTWFCQNWDWVGRQREALVILTTKTKDGESLQTLTEAGMLAKIGFNGHGFALGLNILRSVKDGSKPGVPVHVILRNLLECRTVDKAREEMDRLARIGFAASSNIPVADATGDVACFEITPDGWAELKPDKGLVTHTNHFLCQEFESIQTKLNPISSTIPRINKARELTAGKKLGFEDLKTFLCDESEGYKSICRSPDPAHSPTESSESVAGIIIDVTDRKWWIAPGIPSKSEFAKVSISRVAYPNPDHRIFRQ